MSEPTHTIYQRLFPGGSLREQVAGVTVSREDTPADPDTAAVWLIETGPGFAPPGFKVAVGDRLRDDEGRWWAVTATNGPDATGVCRLDCKREVQ